MPSKKSLNDRLREQHSDLIQGAYYEPGELIGWDATLDAAVRIERLEQALCSVGDYLSDTPDDACDPTVYWHIQHLIDAAIESTP